MIFSAFVRLIADRKTFEIFLVQTIDIKRELEFKVFLQQVTCLVISLVNRPTDKTVLSCDLRGFNSRSSSRQITGA